MSRAKGVPRGRKRRKILKEARGYWGGRSRLHRTAKETLTRAKAFAFRDRRARKRDFRRLWITRIGAATRQRGMSYSKFINGLDIAKVGLDRKVLADIALNDPDAFQSLVDIAAKHISKQ